MKNVFKQFSRKNEKMLRRELALAHSIIVLLSIGLVTILLTVGGQSDIFDQTLVSIASAHLVVVALISFIVVMAIVLSKKLD